MKSLTVEWFTHRSDSFFLAANVFGRYIKSLQSKPLLPSERESLLATKQGQKAKWCMRK
jgi:hypothetical protein